MCEIAEWVCVVASEISTCSKFDEELDFCGASRFEGHVVAFGSDLKEHEGSIGCGSWSQNRDVVYDGEHKGYSCNKPMAP